MGVFNKLFNKNKRKSVIVNLKLNAKLQPIHRGEFEDMVETVLKKNDAGEITGGGTFLLPTREIACCDIEFSIYEDKLDQFIHFLKQIDLIPKGSSIQYNDNEIEIGIAQGLGLYLNGTELPIEVYQNNDINELIEKLDNALENVGVKLSHWEGPNETALYYYGKNYLEMKDKILTITQNHPLCEKCRIDQIA